MNESGAHADEGVTRVGSGSAIHCSAQQATSEHAHFAWKIHVGLDAPVWVRRPGEAAEDVRVLVVPPGVRHATGARGWSAAIFLSPGTRGLPWRGDRLVAPQGAAAARLVDACRAYDGTDRGGFADLADEVARSAGMEPSSSIDPRVEATLEVLGSAPGTAASALARSQGISVDRLSRLVVQATGMGLRKHALWRRLLAVLSDTRRHPTLAAAAFAHGFADHAHLTRTYRSFLGRTPSEFAGPPDVVAPW